MSTSGKKLPTIKAAAICNHRVVMIYWTVDGDEKIPKCLGFSVRRIDAQGNKKPLKAFIRFRGVEADAAIPGDTDNYPVQGYGWKDLRGKEGETYTYEVVPMCGTPGNLKALDAMAVVTNPVTLTDQVSPYVRLRFSNLLSTQSIAKLITKQNEDGSPDLTELLAEMKKPGSQIRKSLSGDLPSMVLSMFKRAEEIDGHIYACNYELSDDEIEDCMVANAKRLSIILSNTGEDDLTNSVARKKLHDAGADITDRMLNSPAIGHNKFMVLVDKEGNPVAVLSGSTNLTLTGLVCQSNNMFIIESAELGQLFLDYYDLLLEDVSQDEALRKACQIAKDPVVLKDGTEIKVWFSPNTDLQVKPKDNPATPPDMAEVFDLMDQADFGIFALAFMPGNPSFLSKLGEINATGKKIVQRVCVSSVQALPRKWMRPTVGAYPVVIAAAALEKDFGPFVKELLKLPEAHAIVHSKYIIVLSRDSWVVITGSHNLGFKASYSNDENMLFFQNNKALALAYLANQLDVYSHYRFRVTQRGDKSRWDGALSTSDKWQERHLTGFLREERDLMPGYLA